MEYLKKEDVGKVVAFDKKYIFGRIISYESIRKENGRLIARIKRHVEDSDIPEYADIIETINGYVIVQANDYEFI